MLPVYVCVSVCVWGGGGGGMGDDVNSSYQSHLLLTNGCTDHFRKLHYCVLHWISLQIKGGTLSTEKACWQVICKNI